MSMNLSTTGGSRLLAGLIGKCFFAALASVALLLATSCAARSDGGESVAHEQSKLATAASGHLLVLIRSANGAFSVVRTKEVSGPLPKQRGRALPRNWQLRALSPDGSALHIGSLPNPHELRGDFADPVTGATSGVFVTRPEAAFLVHVPLGSRTIEFFEAPTNAPSIASNRAASTGPVGNKLGQVTLAP